MSTIGVDFKIKDLEIARKLVRVQIWDTAGQERFRNITNSYYKGAHGIAVVFDVTNRQSFDTVSTWIEEITKKASQNTLNVIIANKIDMTNLRVVSEEEGRSLAGLYNLNYFEASAKDDSGVNEVFDFMSNKILSAIEVSPDYLNFSKDKLLLQAETKPEKKDKCCR
jgi:Ras-related protein Rab-1A